MKILTVNYSDIDGGAARAAYRIHHALRKAGVESTMLVSKAISDDWTVESRKNKYDQVLVMTRNEFGKIFTKILKTENKIVHSPSILSSRIVNHINDSDADIVHLHWVQNEMLSIEDIGKIKKPLVWTLHDMWAFCGAEHYTEDDRWREGYNKNNRPLYEKGFDMNRWVWERKRKAWIKPINMVTPSTWLAGCVKESKLMSEWPVKVIHNAINTEVWCKISKNNARQILGLPYEIPLILFGAMRVNGEIDKRKGMKYLLNALQYLKNQYHTYELVVFGQLPPKYDMNLGYKMHFMGHLYDEVSLKLLYSACDVMVVPSLQDNMPNTVKESLSCGTPVVAFRTSGLPDMIEHKKNGYLAAPHDDKDLAEGIKWVISDKIRHNILSENAREKALVSYNSNNVAKKYIALYEQILDKI